jgi:predicted ATPase
MWRLCFLGNLKAEKDGVDLPLPPRKYTSLLAYLTIHPTRRFGRDELTSLFWPDSDDEAGRAALRTALSTLRKEFGADIFESTGTEMIRVRDGAFLTDTERFTTLLRQASRTGLPPTQETRLLDDALTLYSGPLLPGIYADWAVAMRERLQTDYEKASKRRESLRKIALSEERQKAVEGRFRRKTEGPDLLRLPFYNSRFIGRSNELKQLRALLHNTDQDTPSIRLLTLTGPGGIGKTRLAVEVAQQAVSYFPGALCLVPLAALTEGEEIGSAIADAMQVTTTSGSDSFQQALFRLDELGPSLIVLDNLEQLVETGAAKIVRTLLARLPKVVLLTTSRRLLGVEGEHEFVVSPLDAENCQTLFCEHARAARPEFTGENTTILRALCERLEGIPLAIELCAPWVRLLTEQQMLEHLDKRFRLLTSRRQDIPSRHRSLHATLEWGCPTEPDLLTFFTILSVFRGGFTLQAAEAIGGPEALEFLAILREQSLIQVESSPQGNRYRLLETIREFADEKLTPETRDAAHRRSLVYYTNLAQELTSHLATSDSARYFAALEAESAHFRAVIEFGLTDTPENLWMTYGLIKELRWFWGIRGHRVPLAAWREQACARREELSAPARIWLTLEYATYCAPEEHQETVLRDVLAQFEQIDHTQGIVGTQEALGAFYRYRGDFPPMETAYREAAQRRLEYGDRRGYGYSLANLAGAFMEQGRIPEARLLWQECREISLSLDDLGSVAVLDRAAAGAYLQDGCVEEALPLLMSATSTFRHKGESWQLMDTLHHLGNTLLQQNQLEEAKTALEEALEIAQRRGDAERMNALQESLTQTEARTFLG